MQVELAPGAQLDAFGRLRVSQPETVFDNKHTSNGLGPPPNDPLVWTGLTAGGGTALFNPQAALWTLATAGVAGDRAVRQTKRSLNYQPGKSQLVQATGRLGPGGVGAVNRGGIYNDGNGAFFEVRDAELGVVVRSNTSGAPVDTRVPQSAFNLDRLDGTGPSGVTIDLDAQQIWLVDFQWLGVGDLRFGIEIDGMIVYCHRVRNANVIVVGPYARTMTLPIRFEVLQLAAGASVSIDQVCCTVISEGGQNPTAIVRSVDNGATTRPGVGPGAGTVPMVSIRLRAGFEAAAVFPLDVAVVALTGANCRWGLYLCSAADFSTQPTFTAVPSSPVEADVTFAQAFVGNAAPAIALGSGYFSNNTDTVAAAINSALGIGFDIAGVSDIITLAVQTLNGNETYAAGLTWREVQ